MTTDQRLVKVRTQLPEGTDRAQMLNLLMGQHEDGAEFHEVAVQMIDSKVVVTMDANDTDAHIALLEVIAPGLGDLTEYAAAYPHDVMYVNSNWQAEF